jgi:serine/threonine protein phosphatase PrpC
LSENLYHFFIDKDVKYPLDRDYVNMVYDKLQNVLVTKHAKEATECGSTCLVVCQYKDSHNKDYINILNTGDSRCILSRDNIAHILTRDHKPDWPDEYFRITKLGGVVRKDGNTYRINDLSVSRAFGDKESTKYVTHRPDIYKYKITKRDKFMIIACDGLWDVISPQNAINFVIRNCYDIDMNRINKQVNVAKLLAELAIIKESGDNVTCIVVFFDQ